MALRVVRRRSATSSGVKNMGSKTFSIVTNGRIAAKERSGDPPPKTQNELTWLFCDRHLAKHEVPERVRVDDHVGYLGHCLPINTLYHWTGSDLPRHSERHPGSCANSNS